MANPEHLAILKQGVKEWNAWHDKAREIRPDLEDANLTRTNLCGANLYCADLTGAKLICATARDAALRTALVANPAREPTQ
jgi:uncharacterized protein YjbI with pentapeptide repeats